MKQPKSLVSQLQSRISTRRNLISKLESYKAAYKELATWPLIKKQMKELAESQKLDKMLYNEMLTFEFMKHELDLYYEGDY